MARKDVIVFDNQEGFPGSADTVQGNPPDFFLLYQDLIDMLTASLQSVKFINKPIIGASNQSPLTLSGNGYTTTQYWIGPHTKTVWELASDNIFSNIVETSTVTSGDLYTWNPTTNTPGTYYARVRYASPPETSVWSDWIEITI